jgi:protein involved in polysaccharide export with SLBB domain
MPSNWLRRMSIEPRESTMERLKMIADRRTILGGPNTQACMLAGLLALLGAFAGCTAVSNPIADGIPVRLLSPDILGPCKTNYQTLPLNALRQPQPDAYLLDTGDVLGIFIDGFLGEKTLPVPVQVAPLIQIPGQNRLAPSAGWPIAVESDGNIGLPGVPKLFVRGMSVGAARDAIRDLYIRTDLIRKENERIIVTLMQPRQYQVLVFRQEAQAFLAGQDGPIPISKRNTGQVVDLPAYQNDVLNALARSGGLPELDAYNEIIVCRDANGHKPKLVEQKQMPDGKVIVDPASVCPWAGDTIRIPMRTPDCAPLPFGPEDVVLHNGDVVFLEARDEEVFYTAGLLPPGKHMLPRDQDLDVIDAICMIRGPLYNGAFGGSNLSGTLIPSGLGVPSPSLLVVLRRVPGRGQIPIVVDLRDALRYPQERLVIRPGDVLFLQEKPSEAVVRFITQAFFNFDFYFNVFRSKNGAGIINMAAPDRLPGSVSNTQTILPQQ